MMPNDDDSPEVARTELPEHRGSPPWVPTGDGIALEARLRGWRQLSLTALVITGSSAAGGLRALELVQHKTSATFLLPFVLSIAAMVTMWFFALALRTLRLRRLQNRFPGTLVFSFRRSDDVTAALRRIGLIGEKFSFNEFGIQVVVDLHGMTFWQGSPPQMYAALPWTLVLATSVDRDYYPSSGGQRATVLHIDAGTSEHVTRFSLFSVDASILPFPSRSNVDWVERQLRRLKEQSQREG